MTFINDILKPIFRNEVFSKEVDRFDFSGIQEYVFFNPYEAQIDTGKMMQALLKKAIANDVLILNQVEVTAFQEKSDGVTVTANDFSFVTRKLLFATNGFAAELTNHQVKPARAQVLITNPIPDLDIKGTFHLEQGYYYFRNIDKRNLLGGGRNLDFKRSEERRVGKTELIQNRLD